MGGQLSARLGGGGHGPVLVEPGFEGGDEISISNALARVNVMRPHSSVFYTNADSSKLYTSTTVLSS